MSKQTIFFEINVEGRTGREFYLECEIVINGDPAEPGFPATQWIERLRVLSLQDEGSLVMCREDMGGWAVLADQIARKQAERIEEAIFEAADNDYYRHRA